MTKMNLRQKIFFFNRLARIYIETKKLPRVDLHIHTNWTDGENSVKEMAERACRLKIKTVLFSEHSRKNSKGWFNDFVKEIKISQQNIKKKCELLIGTEVKILNYRGKLDINSEILKKCHLVMASVHRFPGETGDIFKNKPLIKKKDAIITEFKLMMGAIRYSKADIIGHPFGMSLKRFKAKPKWHFYKKIISECKKYKKIFEINYHYHKNCRKLLKECINQGTMFSLGSNAHNKYQLGKIFSI